MDTTSTEGRANRELPSADVLAEAGEVMIRDRDGNECPLKSLWSNKPSDERQLVIFIRHFFCGSCKQYVQALARDLPAARLAVANIKLTIVGCGEPVCIPGYAEATGCPYPIYTDPSVQSYKLLGMTSNIRQGDTRPDYIKRGFLSDALGSFWGGITSGHALSAGPPGQNGGEWLFQGGAPRWCHRMRNSTDHAVTKELKAVLGIDA